jgi:hypothetical protein
MITGDQIREARKLLNLSHLGVALAAGVSQAMVTQCEMDPLRISDQERAKIQRALEAQGIEFASGRACVRMNTQNSQRK